MTYIILHTGTYNVYLFYLSFYKNKIKKTLLLQPAVPPFPFSQLTTVLGLDTSYNPPFWLHDRRPRPFENTSSTTKENTTK